MSGIIKRTAPIILFKTISQILKLELAVCFLCIISQSGFAQGFLKASGTRIVNGKE
jgi:hypothetical protein